MNKIYILTIDNEFGINVSAHSTRDKAFDSLYEYVRTYLGDMSDCGDEIEMPETKEQWVDYYYSWYEDEFYRIDEVTIDEE